MIIEAHAFADIDSRKRPKIVIRNNGIQEIEKYAFRGNSKVRELDLRDNPTETIHNYAFSGLKMVDFLYLPNQRLKSIQRDAFENLTGIHHMEISGKKWFLGQGSLISAENHLTEENRRQEPLREKEVWIVLLRKQ